MYKPIPPANSNLKKQPKQLKKQGNSEEAYEGNQETNKLKVK